MEKNSSFYDGSNLVQSGTDGEKTESFTLTDEARKMLGCNPFSADSSENASS